MKKFRRYSVVTALIGVLVFGVAPGRAVAEPTVELGTAEDFAVLAGTAVTNVPTSTITGDVGLSPTTGAAITGLTCAEVTGTIYDVDGTYPGACEVTNAGLLTQAKNDLSTAYTDAAGRTPTQTFVAPDNQLGGQVLTSGVYAFGAAATANIIGTLTLDGLGDPNAVFIFQASSSLVTASSSVVSLTNSAQACNVFWQVGSSATLGSSSTFVGTIMALTSITVNSAATIEGRALASNAAVTLDSDTITVPSVCTVAVAPPPDSGTPDSGTPASGDLASADSAAGGAVPKFPDAGTGPGN